MEHLLIAYDLAVILIGIMALAMTFFWVSKTRKTNLRNFWFLYAFVTLLLIMMMLKKYLSVNVANYTPQVWYVISGLQQIINFAILVAANQYFLGIYQVGSRKIFTSLFLFAMFVFAGLLVTPIGATLDADQGIIFFGAAFKVAVILYGAAFTWVIAMGYGFLKRIWNTKQRSFVAGLLGFFTFGYIEALIRFPQNLVSTSITLARENDFTFSSIPYALYGIFLINYFLRYTLPSSPTMDTLTEGFLSKYGITNREREIILKIMQGKSNADIAGELVISLATVKTHLHNIYQKLGIDSRYDLLAKVRSGQ